VWVRIERGAGEETDKSTSKGTQHWNHGLRERVGKEKGKNGQKEKWATDDGKGTKM
jgi:hypothetical protein